MLSNLAYLLTSKSITLYILYTLHVMLGTSLVFTALYTYGVHSSKAMARAAALEAAANSGNAVHSISSISVGNSSALELEDEMREVIGGLEGVRGTAAWGRQNVVRKVKSMGMMGMGGSMAWENISTGFVESEGEKEGLRFRGDGGDGVQVVLPGLGQKGMGVEIS